MSKQQFQDIIYSKGGHKARITINRPEVFNAFRHQTYVEFCLACADASADSHIGASVITGSGKKAFSSGGDVREAQARFLEISEVSDGSVMRGA